MEMFKINININNVNMQGAIKSMIFWISPPLAWKGNGINKFITCFSSLLPDGWNASNDGMAVSLD